MNDRAPGVRLGEVVQTHHTVAATRSRTRKTAALAELIAACAPAEAPIVVSYLSGAVPQRRLGVGWRSLSDMPSPAHEPMLTVLGVDAAFTTLAQAGGPGSATVRFESLRDLLGQATTAEQDFLRALITGNLRQGALDGVVIQALAKAHQAAEDDVRRAVMLTGSAASVAGLLAEKGPAGLAGVGVVVGRPLRPMLAASEKTVADAIASAGGGTVLVDGKFDGIRIQAHRAAGVVTLYTRSLDEVTDRLPEVVEAVAGLPGGDLILDGEALALLPDGRPAPFQVTGARTASSVDVESLRTQVPLSTVLFDILHRDGRDLLDEPAHVRHTELVTLAGDLTVPRIVTDDPAAAQDFFDAMVARGHEGVVVKAADSLYAAGRRGSGWVKVKPAHTVDLVVLAVEWGSGRRQGWLSNIHLGARDPATGELVMVGKTFKGMTDAMLQWQTERFTELATEGTGGYVVQVRPEQVVEIAFDGVLASTRYPGGVALRFARVLRYRDDKTAAEADTLAALTDPAVRTADGRDGDE